MEQNTKVEIRLYGGEKITVDAVEIGGFEQAIEDFNNHNGAAAIWYNRERNEAFTEVYANDIHLVSTVAAHSDVAEIFQKTEYRPTHKVGEKNKRALSKVILMFRDGYYMSQIEYLLAHELAYLY